MLKIHKPFSKHKLFLISITSICITFGLLGFYYLTYIPELSHAETVTYDPIPRYHPNISDITFIQDMTEEVCQNSYENDTKQLIDKRDSKTYWVAKLKDGNCWMTQNLALDLDTTKPLTNTDSDVSSNYTPSANTQQGTITKFPSNSDRTLSYNPGEYIYTTPTERNSCGSSGITKLEGCPNWTLATGLSKDTNSNEQAHYLAGNYYSYEVATAGYTASSNSAPNSICPKGWQLPENQASTAGTTVVKSYRNLLDNYGWSWNQGSDPSKHSDSLTGTKDDNTYDIRSNPLYFVYGGTVNSSSLIDAGSYGYYWSSTANSASHAYLLYFYTRVLPSENINRYYGLSVRCVARGEAVVRPEAPSVDNVVVNINSQISLDIENEIVVEKSEDNPSTADLSVKVSSNQPYSVNINAREHAELTSENGDKIPSNGGALITAENNWGIMKPGDTTYTKVTTTPQLFYQATSAEVKDILFKIGISTAPDLANGIYATDIVITATQN